MAATYLVPFLGEIKKIGYNLGCQAHVLGSTQGPFRHRHLVASRWGEEGCPEAPLGEILVKTLWGTP